MKYVLLILVLFLALASTVSADSTFTIGAGTADATDCFYIKKDNGTTHFAGTNTFDVGDSGSAVSGPISTLLRWNAVADSLNKGAGIGVYIKACTLLVHLVGADGAGNTTGQMYVSCLRRSPGDGTTPIGSIEWTNATYNKRANGLSNWGTTGCWSTTSDIDTTGMGATKDTVVCRATDSIGFKKWCITSVAQNMDYSDSAKWRKGLMLHGKYLGTGGAGFDAVDVQMYGPATGNTPYRIQIKVVYTKAVQPPVASGGSDGRRRKEYSRVERINTYAFGR